MFFVVPLGLSPQVALIHHNLAPVNARRDMAMLTVIHRCTLNQGPPTLRRFFPRDDTPISHTTRRTHSHDHKLREYDIGHHPNVIHRSILGLIPIYDQLPTALVQCRDIKQFQGGLQSIIKPRLTSGKPDWLHFYSPRVPRYERQLHLFHDWSPTSTSPHPALMPPIAAANAHPTPTAHIPPPTVTPTAQPRSYSPVTFSSPTTYPQHVPT